MLTGPRVWVLTDPEKRESGCGVGVREKERERERAVVLPRYSVLYGLRECPQCLLFHILVCENRVFVQYSWF